MAGFIRRSKPIKGRQALDDISELSIANPSNGDLIVFNSGTGFWENTKSLEGAYLLTGSLTATTLTATGVLTGNSLYVATTAVIDGALTVAGSLAAGAATLAALTVSGNASVGGTLTITGTLAFAGFSVSGSGTIAGNLTVGGTLAVTGATTLAGALNVTGAATLAQQLIVVGAVNFASSLTVSGNIVGNNVAGNVISGTVGNFNTVVMGAAAYTSNGITFEDDGTSIDILNGTTTLLSLRTVGVIEGTGSPAGVITANAGSLFLRTDGNEDRTLYYKVRGTGTDGWTAVVDHTTDIEWLYERQLEHGETLQALQQTISELQAQVDAL